MRDCFDQETPSNLSQNKIIHMKLSRFDVDEYNR